MDMSHGQIDSILGLYRRIFVFLTFQLYFFCFMWNYRSMDISHDHTDFGPQIPFLGSRGQFLPFWPPKVYFFMLHVKFPIDGCITRPYWFWAPNSVFGLWGPILYKISDRLMGHMTYFIFEPPSAQPRDHGCQIFLG
jgi:hypothetical protein